MKLPNWLRITWWVLLSSFLTLFLFFRLGDLIAGKATPFDMLAFGVLVCLLLAPVFTEVEMLGIKLKQEIASVKAHVDERVDNLRAEIRNSIDVRSDFRNQITFTTPPPDDQLPKIEERVRETLKEELGLFGLNRLPRVEPSQTIPRDNIFFFETRFLIERELQRIWKNHIASEQGFERVPLVTLALDRLVSAQLLTPQMAKAVREVYSVCSPAIHGQAVTEAQRRFVDEVAPDLLRTLRAIT